MSVRNKCHLEFESLCKACEEHYGRIVKENRELREVLEKIAGIGLGGEGTLMAREFLLTKSGDRHE